MNKTDVQVTRKGVLAQSSDMKTAISTNSPTPPPPTTTTT
jgi:hypothetical protein